MVRSSYRKEELMLLVYSFKIKRCFIKGELAKMLKVDIRLKAFEDMWEEFIKRGVLKEVEEGIFIDIKKSLKNIPFYSVNQNILKKHIEQYSSMFKQIYNFMNCPQFLGLKEFYYPLS